MKRIFAVEFEGKMDGGWTPCWVRHCVLVEDGGAQEAIAEAVRQVGTTEEYELRPTHVKLLAETDQ